MSIFTILAAGEPDPSSTNDWRIAIITVVGVIAAAFFSYLASRYSARQATRASKNTDHVTERQVDVGEWTSLVGSLQAEVKRLGERVTELENVATVNRGRIDTLEGTLRNTERKYHMAVQYIRDVVLWSQRLLGEKSVPPVPPPEIKDDLELINPTPDQKDSIP